MLIGSKETTEYQRCYQELKLQVSLEPFFSFSFKYILLLLNLSEWETELLFMEVQT